MAVQIPDPSAKLALDDGRPSQTWYGILSRLARLLNETEAAVGDASAGLDSKLSQGKHTIWVPAAAMTPDPSTGPELSVYEPAGDTVLHVLAFDASSTESAYFSVAMPKSWDEGTVTFAPYWTNESGLTTEVVVWRLAALAFSDGDSLATSHSSAQSVTDTWIAQDALHIGQESSAITVAGSPASNDLVNFRIQRRIEDAADTMTGDAMLIGIKILYSVNAGNDA